MPPDKVESRLRYVLGRRAHVPRLHEKTVKVQIARRPPLSRAPPSSCSSANVHCSVANVFGSSSTTPRLHFPTSRN